MIKQFTFILLVILLSGCAKRNYIDDTFFTQKNNDSIHHTNDKFLILSAAFKDILVENTDNIIFNNLENKKKIYIAFSKHQKEEVIGKNKYHILDLEKDYPQGIEGIQFSVKTFAELRKIANKTSSFNAIQSSRIKIMDEKYAELTILIHNFPDAMNGNFENIKLALEKIDATWVVHKRKIEHAMRY